MKLINDRWIDEHNNSWSTALYCKEKAEALSTTMINCRDCRDCRDCSGCSGCRDCSDCRDCSGCRGCSGCSYYNLNPQRYTHSIIGSRNDNPTVYWIGDNIQCVVGCFRGDLTALETKVKENYPSGKHHDDYMEFIRIAKWLINETKTKQERSIIK